MSLLITDMKEVNVSPKDYEQIKDSVKEIKGKVNDFNFLSTELDALHDTTTRLLERVESINKDLIKNNDELQDLYRDLDNTL